jgi:outer membrane protein OmpA-like peptidoglycan-associated protein
MATRQPKQKRSPTQTRKKSRYWGWKVAITIGSGAAVLAVVVWLIASGELNSIRDADSARALITFLYSLGIMSIFVILSYTILTDDNSMDEKQFQRSKDVLMIVIGIFGTIIGFYFGSPDEKAAAQPAEPGGLTIRYVHISPEEARSGQSVEMLSFVSGGTGPYSYSVVFTSFSGAEGLLPPVTNGLVDDGLIRRVFTVPDVTDHAAIGYQILIEDAEGTKADPINGVLLVSPAIERINDESDCLLRVTHAMPVLFEFDDAEIREDAEPALWRLVRQIDETLGRSEAEVIIRVDGHADAVGEDAYNLDLSRRRAEAVRGWLVVEAGIPSENIVTKAFGERNPVLRNARPDGRDHPDGRAANRRVEITLVESEGAGEGVRRATIEPARSLTVKNS